MLEPLRIMTEKLNAAADKAMDEINALEKELESMHVGTDTLVQCPEVPLILHYGRYNGGRYRIMICFENAEKPASEWTREVKIEAAKHLSVLIDAIVKKIAKLIGEDL